MERQRKEARSETKKKVREQSLTKLEVKLVTFKPSLSVIQKCFAIVLFHLERKWFQQAQDITIATAVRLRWWRSSNQNNKKAKQAIKIHSQSQNIWNIWTLQTFEWKCDILGKNIIESNWINFELPCASCVQPGQLNSTHFVKVTLFMDKGLYHMWLPWIPWIE